MTDYTKGTDFAAKDALSTGNPAKIVKGTEIDDELVAISGAISSKADLASPTFTGVPAAPTASAGTNTTQLATTAFANTAAAAVSPSGEIKMWATATAPTGFLLCSGAAVSRTIYAALFAVIGTTFGSGDGTTTFNLPNFNNRMPIGAGDLYAVAATGGSKDAIVVSHTHGSGATGAGGQHYHGTGDYANNNGTWFYGTYSQSGPTGSGTSWNGSGDGTAGNTSAPTSGDTVTSFAINSSSGASHTHTIASEGSSGTGANLPPYLGVYFIIKT